MERDEVLRRLRELCARVLSVPEETVVPQARLVADLEADSLDFAELEAAVHEVFGVAMDENDVMERAVTVADIADLVLAGHAAGPVAEVSG
ncbi:acyl carrier protein [Streptomyces phaeochromogenes]|uniref:acyl carrier protein n=1 Tax=Streptomyces phaeochromogenes TaxID=1923 RepID=UPI0037137E3D